MAAIHPAAAYTVSGGSRSYSAPSRSYSAPARSYSATASATRTYTAPARSYTPVTAVTTPKPPVAATARAANAPLAAKVYSAAPTYQVSYFNPFGGNFFLWYLLFHHESAPYYQTAKPNIGTATSTTNGSVSTTTGY